MKSKTQSCSQRGLKTKTSSVLSNQIPMKVGDFIRIVGNAFSTQINPDKRSQKFTNQEIYQAVLSWFTDVTILNTRKVEDKIVGLSNNYVNKIINPNSSKDISRESAAILKSQITSENFEDIYREAKLSNFALNNLIKQFSDYGYKLNRNNIPKSLAFTLIKLLEERAIPIKLNQNLVRYQKYIDNYVKENALIKNIVFRYEPIHFYDLYVCNRLSEHKNSKDKKADYIFSSYPATLIEKYGRFITITGPAGYGKSMYLKHLSLCEYCFKDNPNIKKTNYVPILIRLNNIKDKNVNLESILYSEVTKYDSSINLRTFKNSLFTGRFMLLFDALDEIDTSISDTFIHELESFAQKYNENVIILSSRPNNLSILDKFKDLLIENFGQDEIEKLCLKLGKLTNIGRDKTFNFIGNVFLNNPHFDSVDSIPLLLTLKFYVYKETNKIANNNSTDFYHQCFHLLFIDHDQINNKYNGRIIKKYSEDELEIIIGKFAYFAILNHKISFNHIDIVNLLKKANVKIQTQEFINYLLLYLCLFYKENGQYQFIHRSFQDYFASRYIYSLNSDDDINSFINDIKNFSLINAIDSNPVRFVFYWVQGFDDIFKFLVDLDKIWFEEKIVYRVLFQIFETKDISNPILNYIYHTFDDVWWYGGVIDGAPPTNSYKNDLVGFIANDLISIHYDEHCVKSLYIDKYAQEEFYIGGTNKNGDPQFITRPSKIKMMKKKHGDDWANIDLCDGHISCANIMKLLNDNDDRTKEVLNDIENAFKSNYLLLNKLYSDLKNKFNKR